MPRSDLGSFFFSWNGRILTFRLTALFFKRLGLMDDQDQDIQRDSGYQACLDFVYNVGLRLFSRGHEHAVNSQGGRQ
jgi:hypothetical protein